MDIASRQWRILRTVFNITIHLLARRRRKKALLIAMNYTASNLKGVELKFPQRDMKEMRRLLKETFGFQDEDIITLSDDPAEVEAGLSLLPTRENIMKMVEGFIIPGQHNTDYVLFYSGHSDQHSEPFSEIPIEEDGLQEFILPVDAKTDSVGEYLPEWVIYDTYLHDNIIVPLEQTKGSHLFALFDACHSCTILNLMHHRCNRVGTITSTVRRAVRHYIVEDILLPIRDYFYQKQNAESAEPPNSTPNRAEVKKCNGLCPRVPNLSQKSITICMSACKDSERVLEVDNSRTLTSAIVGLLEVNPKASLKDVMHTARCVVDEARQAAKKDVHYSRRWSSMTKIKKVMEDLRRWNPQLSSNDPLDTNTTLMYSDLRTYGRNRHGRVQRPVWESVRRLLPGTVTNYMALPTGASPSRIGDAS